MRTPLLFVTCLLVFAGFKGAAQPISQKQLDDLCNRAIKTFNVPGLAVVVVKDGQIAFPSLARE